MIYFIKSADFVKIGFAKTLPGIRNRLASLQTGTPHQLVLTAWMVGEKQEEKELHRRFKKLKVTGEWFRNEGQLTALIGSLDGSLEKLPIARGRGRPRIVPKNSRERKWWATDAEISCVKREAKLAGISIQELVRRKMLRRKLPRMSA